MEVRVFPCDSESFQVVERVPVCRSGVVLSRSETRTTQTGLEPIGVLYRDVYKDLSPLLRRPDTGVTYITLLFPVSRTPVRPDMGEDSNWGGTGGVAEGRA